MELFTIYDERTKTTVHVHVYKAFYNLIDKANLVTLASNIVLPTCIHKPS